MNIESVLKHKYPEMQSYFRYENSIDNEHYYNVSMIDDSYVNILVSDIVEYYNQNKAAIDNIEKLTLLRKIRDNLIMSTITWIKDRHESEREGIELGVETKTTLTSEQYKAWLLYWQALRDLPEIDLTNYTLQDISNMVMFPEIPEVV